MSRPVTWGHIATFVLISPGYLLLIFLTYTTIISEAIFSRLCYMPVFPDRKEGKPDD
jgi:hypothetical protein